MTYFLHVAIKLPHMFFFKSINAAVRNLNNMTQFFCKVNIYTKLILFTFLLLELFNLPISHNLVKKPEVVGKLNMQTSIVSFYVSNE